MKTFNARALATCHPSLARGMVWCTVCGRSQKVDSGECLSTGWPKCHNLTMTLDSPAERAAEKGSAANG